MSEDTETRSDPCLAVAEELALMPLTLAQEWLEATAEWLRRLGELGEELRRAGEGKR